MHEKFDHSNILVFKLTEIENFENLDVPNETSHFIADLSELSFEKIEMIKENLVIFGRSIYEKKGSFVIVSSHNFHEYLNIVPSLQEAYDFIQMEDIERQFNI
ncbi:MAG: hypothetical protein CMP51_06680 [Flavobacteriales bacterium]|nr:hypothetical protein [Flavobacteriales bacterium]|tara:strand:- start:1960 stop:2268 length:309 start_codon:yes stop_codon:yes gene_type:complete